MLPQKIMLSCLTLFTLSFTSCNRTTETNTHERLNALLWMQTSAEYHVLATSAYQQARAAIDAGLAQPNWTAAIEQKENFETLPPAIILDIDETVLDNLPYQAQLIKTHTEFNPTSWNQWTQQASAQPVPGASEFLLYAASKGVSVFYVTNRDTTQEADTRKNLAKVNLPLRSDIDVVLTKNEKGWNTSDKSARRTYVAEKFRIIALVGDDFGDFDAAAYETAEKRVETATARVNYWGTKWFLIPNPVYGSWEGSLYNHNNKTPAADILSIKFNKLITPL